MTPWAWATDMQMAEISRRADEMRAALREYHTANGMSMEKKKGAKVTVNGTEFVPKDEKIKDEKMLVPGKRIGDARRDLYIDHLREMCAEGYIDEGIFRERLTSAMAAVTESDLTELIRDLPSLPAAVVPVIAHKEKSGFSASMAFALSSVAMFILFILTIVNAADPSSGPGRAAWVLSGIWTLAFGILSVVTKER